MAAIAKFISAADLFSGDYFFILVINQMITWCLFHGIFTGFRIVGLGIIKQWVEFVNVGKRPDLTMI